jgi:hypothetical protein
MMATDDEPLDAEFKPLAIRLEAPPQLLDALRPADRVALMAEIATVVKDVIEKQGWFKQIGPKKHIRIEGWTFIAGLGGCSAKTISTEKVDGGFKAHAVVVRVDSGVEVGSAEQVCMSSEYNWKGKDDYALIGMASTRACSRALSTVFRHVVELAGYSATPAEEMVKDTPAVPPEPPSEPDLSNAELEALWRRKGEPEGTGRAFIAKAGSRAVAIAKLEAMPDAVPESLAFRPDPMPDDHERRHAAGMADPAVDAEQDADEAAQDDPLVDASTEMNLRQGRGYEQADDEPDPLEKERRRMFAISKDRGISDAVRRMVLLRLFGPKCMADGKPSSKGLSHAQLVQANFELENYKP